MKLNKFLEEYFYLIGFVSIYFYNLFFIIFPFVTKNKLIAWDTAGLYFSVWYQKYYLFPHLFGWNPFFFLGYPQNQFYSPAFTYIASFLSFIFSLDVAFKISVVIILLLIPLSFYYFVRSFKFSKNQSSLIMLLMFIVLFIFKDPTLGINFFSLFNTGLITNSAGMVLLFFYFGSLIRNFESNKYIIPSLLFAGVILTHILTAFVASFGLFAFILLKLRDKKSFSFIFKHILLTSLLTAFWTIPLLAKFSYSNSVSISSIFYFNYILIFFLIYLIYFIIKKDYRISFIVLFLIILISLNFLQIYYNLLPIQYFRFTLYIFLMTPIIFFSIFNIKKIYLLLILFIIGFSIIPLIDFSNPEGVSTMPELKNINYNLNDSRTMIVTSYQTSPQILQQYIPLHYNINAIKGLYVESSLNSPYILSLDRVLDPNALLWGVYDYSQIANKNKTLEILPYQLNLLGVNYIIYNKKIISDWQLLNNITTFFAYDFGRNKLENVNYDLYRVGNSSLIEVLNYQPRVYLGKDWNFFCASWFFSSDVVNGIYVNEKVPNSVGIGNESVNIIEMSKTKEYIKFHVNSTKDVPILIKISQFPNWNVYQDGKKLHIYRASPYLMLVYGHGNLELKYESTYSDIFGVLLTFIGILFLIYSFLKVQFNEILKTVFEKF